MFTQVEDLLPVISFESKKDTRPRSKHNEFVKRMLARGYTPAPGPPPGRVVHAGQQGGVEGRAEIEPHWIADALPDFIDRRLNPKGKSLGNRQRFLRRARAQIREAVQKSLKDRTVADIGKDGRSRFRPKASSEPRFRLSRDGGERDFVLPGNKEFVAGRPDQEAASAGEGGGAASEAADSGDGEDDFTSR